MRPHQIRARRVGGMFDQSRHKSPWLVDMGRGCCQVQIEQGPRALSTKGGEFHRSPRRAARTKRNQKQGKQAKASKQACQTPPGSRHCFMIPGAGPWVRGFHVCAGQLGSDRATDHVLLHRAIFLTSSINHQAWARDAPRPGRAGCPLYVAHEGRGGRVRSWEFVMMSSAPVARVHVIAYALMMMRRTRWGETRDWTRRSNTVQGRK